MRLTSKIEHNYIVPDNVENIITKSLNKLGQLEDIEEELGIDLITLFKALKNGVWYKTNTYHLGNKKQEIRFGFPKLCSQPLFESLYLKLDDEESENISFGLYGKTWALTKGELNERN